MEVLLELTHQDVSDVVLRRVCARRHVTRFVQVRQLRGARETGRHLEDPELLRSVATDDRRRLRPRAHETHLAFEDIEKLRQLVETQRSKHPANPGDACVDAPGDRRMLISIHDHRAKLVEPEGPPLPTDTDLREEDRPPRIELYRDRDERQHRQRDEQADDRTAEIEKSLAGQRRASRSVVRTTSMT